MKHAGKAPCHAIIHTWIGKATREIETCPDIFLAVAQMKAGWWNIAKHRLCAAIIKKHLPRDAISAETGSVATLSRYRTAYLEHGTEAATGTVEAETFRRTDRWKWALVDLAKY